MAKRGPRPAHERLKRLLVMLPWLMQREEVPVSEMAAHFALTEAELIADIERAAMCGLPPYQDELIDVYIDEGMVKVGVRRLFTRPFRLTAPEGFALLVASRSAMQLPGADPTGPLGRALDKLALELGDDAVVVDLDRPEVTDELAAAAASGQRLRMSYWTPSRDEVTNRDVTPRAVFTDSGHWYLLADDHRSGEERNFRIDRIMATEATGVFDDARAVVVPDARTWFIGDPDFERATLRMPTDMLWMIERYPTDSITQDESFDDMSIVVLAVTGEQWLSRLLLRLGASAVVLQPERWSSLAAIAAQAVLRRYGVESSDT
jgi:proteasome accessory factor C